MLVDELCTYRKLTTVPPTTRRTCLIAHTKDERHACKACLSAHPDGDAIGRGGGCRNGVDRQRVALTERKTVVRPRPGLRRKCPDAMPKGVASRVSVVEVTTPEVRKSSAL